MIYRKIINKYNYIKPEALVVPTEASVILACSTIEKAAEEDYSDAKVSNFWESNDCKSIWAD